MINNDNFNNRYSNESRTKFHRMRDINPAYPNLHPKPYLYWLYLRGCNLEHLESEFRALPAGIS